MARAACLHRSGVRRKRPRFRNERNVSPCHNRRSRWIRRHLSTTRAPATRQSWSTGARSVCGVGGYDRTARDRFARRHFFIRNARMILCADSISRSFSGRRVLSSARLAVERGQVVGVLGRMGMGKSTLMKICAGVLDADSGWVEFAGQQYQRPRLSTLASRGLFYLAESDNLASALTVRQHFDLIEKRFGSGDRALATESMKLEPFLDARRHALGRRDTTCGARACNIAQAVVLARRRAVQERRSNHVRNARQRVSAPRQQRLRGCRHGSRGERAQAISRFRRLGDERNDLFTGND